MDYALLVASDNSTVVSYMNAGGGTVSHSTSRALEDMHILASSQQVRLHAASRCNSPSEEDLLTSGSRSFRLLSHSSPPSVHVSLPEPGRSGSRSVLGGSVCLRLPSPTNSSQSLETPREVSLLYNFGGAQLAQTTFALGSPLDLPLRRDLPFEPVSLVWHPWSERLSIHAWLVSGKAC